MSLVLEFFAPLCYFILTTAGLVVLTRRSFGKCLPLAMFASAFLLFFSQIFFNTFTVGFILALAFAVFSLALILIHRKRWPEYKKLLLTSGFMAFLVIYVLVFIFDLKREFSVWDELSHWGMMVKEMFRLDQFYSVDASNLLVHKDYPPIMQLFELFWLKLCGGFSEACVECALHTFELSLIVPFIAEAVSKKFNVLKSVVFSAASVFALALVMLFFDQHGVIDAIYVDYEMALLVIFLLLTLLTTKKLSWFEIATLSAGGSFLLLLKQMGLPLYLMTLCFLAIIYFLKSTLPFKEALKKLNLKKLLLAGAILLIPFILYFLWGKLTEGATKQFEFSDFSLSNLIRIFTGHGAEWQRVTIRNYLTALGQRNITTSYIQLSFLQIIPLFVGAMWLIYRLFRKTLDKKTMIWTTATIILGATGYAAAMLILYVTSFGESEGPNLASYDRYMGTYAILMFGLVLAIIIWQTSLNKRRNVLYALALCLVFINASGPIIQLYPHLYDRYAPYEKYALTTDDLRATIPEDSSVYLLAEHKSWWGYQFFAEYYGTPLRFNWAHAWLTDPGADFDTYYSEMLTEMSAYDYLLVVDVDEPFEKAYCDKLKLCPLNPGDLYKLEKSNDGKIKHFKLIKEGITIVD